MEEVLDAFRVEEIGGMVEQRERLVSKHRAELASLRDTNRWQKQEITDLRGHERELLLGDNEELPEHVWAARRLRSAQGLSADTGAPQRHGQLRMPAAPALHEETCLLHARTQGLARRKRRGRTGKGSKRRSASASRTWRPTGTSAAPFPGFRVDKSQLRTHA